MGEDAPHLPFAIPVGIGSIVWFVERPDLRDREYPATSAARMAARRRVEAMTGQASLLKEIEFS